VWWRHADPPRAAAQSEFVSIGETAILQWGYTDGSPVPGMGFDATAGNIPIGTAITYNIVHEGECAREDGEGRWEALRRPSVNLHAAPCSAPRQYPPPPLAHAAQWVCGRSRTASTSSRSPAGT